MVGVNSRAIRRALGMSAATLGVLLILSGCAETVNEGATDYRKATIDRRSAEGAPTDISKKYALSDTTDFAGNGAIPIMGGRRYYVSLLQAFVGPEARVGGSNWFGEHEQIALVLRVHDSNDRAHPGRLVFFTDDLKLGGQFLNFSNLLTIGPTDYAGGVVTIDVDEIHLRGTTDHIKQMLQELAQEPDCPLGHHPASSGHDMCDDEPTAHAGGPSDTAQSSLVGPAPNKRRTWEARERDLFNLVDTDGYSTRYTLTLLPSGGLGRRITSTWPICFSGASTRTRSAWTRPSPSIAPPPRYIRRDSPRRWPWPMRCSLRERRKRRAARWHVG